MPTAFSLNYIITSGSEEPDAYVLEYAAIFNCRFVEQIVTPVVLRVSLLSGTAIHIHIHTQTLGMRELSGSRTHIHNIVAIFPLNHQLIKRTSSYKQWRAKLPLISIEQCAFINNKFVLWITPQRYLPEQTITDIFQSSAPAQHLPATFDLLTSRLT